MSGRRKVVRAVECGHDGRRHEARGLCKTCYNRAHDAGVVEGYPLTIWPDSRLRVAAPRPDRPDPLDALVDEIIRRRSTDV